MGPDLFSWVGSHYYHTIVFAIRVKTLSREGNLPGVLQMHHRMLVEGVSPSELHLSAPVAPKCPAPVINHSIDLTVSDS
jgi:pentatricopeptide repeat protein